MALAMICDKCLKTFAAQPQEGWEAGPYHISTQIESRTSSEVDPSMREPRPRRVDLCRTCLSQLLME